MTCYCVRYFPPRHNSIHFAAAWKVIKAWLPAAAVKKIKFLTKSNMGEYIDEDNRLEVSYNRRE